mgnify:FL=1
MRGTTGSRLSDVIGAIYRRSADVTDSCENILCADREWCDMLYTLASRSLDLDPARHRLPGWPVLRKWAWQTFGCFRQKTAGSVGEISTAAVDTGAAFVA